MSLDVHLQPRPQAPQIGDDYEVVASFEDEGYYWFLYPLFEQLKQKTGVFVSDYECSIFGGRDLDALSETIAEARQRIKSRPEQWNARTGVQLTPKKRDIYSVVRKAVLKKLLLDLEAAVETAKAHELYVVFQGD